MSSLSVLSAVLITTLLSIMIFPTTVLAADDDETVEQQFGGEPISEEKYRYFTAITSRTGNFRCSGVLIGRRFVATAAHCVSGSVDTTFVDVGYFCVRRDNCGRPHEVIAIDSVATIPGDRGDFAILTLEKAPSTRPKIRPIIPDLGGKILKTLLKKSKMTIVGGGRPAEGLGPSEFVEQLTVRYIPLKKCKKRGLSRDLYGMICSEPVGGRRAGPCEGDSGGPVIVRRKGVEYLLAVHSFGKRVCGSERVKPDGHATVKTASKLIRSVICDGAYPEDWCNDEKKPAPEPAKEPSMKEPTGNNQLIDGTKRPTNERKTRGPTNKLDLIDSEDEPTTEPTTEPTKEPTTEEEESVFEPTNDGLKNDGGLVSTVYAAVWETIVSDCAAPLQLDLRCTGEGATIHFEEYFAQDTEFVICLNSGQDGLTCSGLEVSDLTFLASVNFRCTSSSENKLTADATIPATSATCFGNTPGANKSVVQAVRLAVFCVDSFELNGMQCTDESTVVTVEDQIACSSSAKCPTTAGCTLPVGEVSAQYPTKPPKRCLF